MKPRPIKSVGKGFNAAAERRKIDEAARQMSPEDRDRLIRFLAHSLIEAFLEDFHREYHLNPSNPLPAWFARNLARKNDHPVPEWVEEYLDECCNRLSGNRKPREILGMDTQGRGSFRSRYETMAAKLKAAHYYVDVKTDHPEYKDEQVFAHVAMMLAENDGIVRAVGTIKNWFYEIKPLIKFSS